MSNVWPAGSGKKGLVGTVSEGTAWHLPERSGVEAQVLEEKLRATSLLTKLVDLSRVKCTAVKLGVQMSFHHGYTWPAFSGM